MSSTTWQSSLTMPVVPGRDHVRGRIDAPATMVEYGDYECPFCRMAFDVVEEIVDELGDNLLFVYRHFPLSTVHPHAVTAAEAAEAAGAQGRFWDMHRLLYADQQHLGGQALMDRAQALGLATDRFVDDLRAHVHAEKVETDFLSGVRSGVNGTPTLFINGRRHDGPADRASLLRALR